MTKQPPWSPEEIATMDRMLSEDRSYVAIANALDRTEIAVRVKQKKLGIRSRRKRQLNANTIAKLLGVRCSKTVATWMEDGRLSFHFAQGAGGRARARVASPRNLLRFLQASKHWHIWDWERITNPKLQSWAMKMRDKPAGRFLTTAGVARRTHVVHQTVNQWIHKGWLPARRGRGNWRICEKDLEGFVIPSNRSKVGRNRLWTDVLRRDLLQAVLNAEHWNGVAEIMGMTTSACSAQYYREAAPRPADRRMFEGAGAEAA